MYGQQKPVVYLISEIKLEIEGLADENCVDFGRKRRTMAFRVVKNYHFLVINFDIGTVSIS